MNTEKNLINNCHSQIIGINSEKINPKFTDIYSCLISKLTKLYTKKNNILCVRQDNITCMKKLKEVLPDNGEYSFIPRNLSTIVNSEIMKCDIIKFHNVNIHVYYSSKKINIREIICIIQFVCALNNTNIETLVLDLFIVLSSLEKYMPKNKYFLAENINSGYSTSKLICIYRKEEYIKVLFHELIHYFNMDNYTDNDKITKLIKSKFNIHKNVYFSECVTELKTIILHTIYKSLKRGIGLLKAMEIELKFSLFQTSKIYRHQLKYISSNNDNVRSVFIHQKTHAFAYHILKTYMLYSLLNDPKYIFDDEFNYADLLENINYEKVDVLINELIYSQPQFAGKCKWLLTTLRMSIL